MYVLQWLQSGGQEQSYRVRTEVASCVCGVERIQDLALTLGLTRVLGEQQAGPARRFWQQYRGVSRNRRRARARPCGPRAVGFPQCTVAPPHCPSLLTAQTRVLCGVAPSVPALDQNVGPSNHPSIPLVAKA